LIFLLPAFLVDAFFWMSLLRADHCCRDYRRIFGNKAPYIRLHEESESVLVLLQSSVC
jgi:hypothetical protein